MGTNCAPLLADLFLYYYESDFMQELLRKKDKKLTISLNSTFCSIDVLSLNNSKFGDCGTHLSHQARDKGYYRYS